MSQFEHISTTNQYQAVIANMLLCEVESTNFTSALRTFNEKIDARITGWEIYRNGKLAYTYDRVRDRVVPYDRSAKTGRVLVTA